MFKSGFIKLNKGEPPKEKTTKAPNDRGVVYLGHVPHGFYENEMKHYFTQFGEVTNINIPKSKKTGKAKGYAFVEFLYPEVAKVVAETMNNYLMHKKILVAKYLSPNQVKSNTFWRCNKNQIPLTIKNRSIQRKAMERPLNPEQEKSNSSNNKK
uniref:MKI67 FHA domain-interacting nucleolar phosphoprotein-like n=1 Tax=Schizaphis graminum TaxID=13262 RepID=A0A2S2NF60_SCHGA